MDKFIKSQNPKSMLYMQYKVYLEDLVNLVEVKTKQSRGSKKQRTVAITQKTIIIL